MPENRDQSFPRGHRILRKADFDRIIRRGVRASDARLRLRVLGRDPGEPTRLGITVGRKAGNAVARNRVRRRLREAFRLRHADLPEGIDIVVFPNVLKGESPPTRGELEESLLALAGEARRRLDRRGSARPPGRPPSRKGGPP